MSGSQHNPNGRQSQLGSGWSPLQLQMANLLARAPQAHMASDRGVTWHTPTPPPHLYHVPAPSPPDPLQMDAMLQAMKTGSNSVFRHTATPPDLYRHTPTPPDKHLMRHTPSPGDVKAGAAIPPVDLYPHLGPARDKLVRAEELLAYARVGVDLSLGSRANGATPPASAHPASHPAPHPASPALSVRDAPTINSLIARAAPRRVDSLLERLVPSPASPAAPSPHSVIVHSRVAPTPSPPSSNEDSVDSISAGGSKRKRKPERTVRVGARCSPAPAPAPPLLPALAVENGDTLPLHNGPDKPPDPAPHPASHVAPPPDPAPAPAPYDPAPPVAAATAPPSPRPNDTVNSTRRKTRSGSAETIADIAAMIAAGGAAGPVPPLAAPPLADKLETVLASPDPADPSPQPPPAVVAPEKDDDRLSETQSTSTGETTTAATSAAAPRRAPAPAATATAPVESPSEAAAPAPVAPPAPPAPQASFVEVENQLEKMFAALDDGSTAATAGAASTAGTSAPPPKRRKSAPARPRKGPRKKADAKPRHKEKELTTAKDAYDSGSNASSGRSRGPYIQIRGPRESPVSVTVMNAATGEEEESARGGSRRGRAGAGERRTGLHASTLGLRYDACTRDATWLCAFCGRGPHSDALGDLFGPYPVDTDHDEYRALDEVARRAHTAPAPAAGCEVWVHADCAVWAPGVVARGARVWGLARAVWAAAAARCRHCARTPASIACAARACSMRAHLPCARAHSWRLDEADFRAVCPAHANSV